MIIIFKFLFIYDIAHQNHKKTLKYINVIIFKDKYIF
jgi:hypothetical protein